MSGLASMPTGGMPKILIVEDEEPLREVYQLILGMQAYKVDVARNGRQALNKCAVIDYDLILLDLMMPVLDGVGFLEQFAMDERVLPKVVIISNLSDGTSLNKALGLGAIRAVLKADLSPSQLVSTVRHELGS